MTTSDRNGGRRAELYVRETLPAPAARQCERLTDRLAALDDEGCVDSHAVVEWGKRIPLDGAASSEARDRYLAFEAWARDAGVSLAPCFDSRVCYSMETGEKRDWIVFPALCLAVYEDGALASVFPHADGDSYRSVTDGLDALGRTRRTHAKRSEEERGESDRAPVGTAD